MADRRPMLRWRDGDRLGSLISHARRGLALAIPSLPMAVSLFPALMPLVPAVCRAPLVATGPSGGTLDCSIAAHDSKSYRP
jgi:hypothetical protein